VAAGTSDPSIHPFTGEDNTDYPIERFISAVEQHSNKFKWNSQQV
jgi:hypothetical protein